MRATFTSNVTPVTYLTYDQMMANPGVYDIKNDSCTVLVLRGVSRQQKIITTIAVNVHTISDGNNAKHYPCSGAVYYKKSGTLNIEV